MQIINRDYGYIEAFDCVIKGKIVMTRQEWEMVQNTKGFKASLFNPDDLKRSIETQEGSRLYNVRYTATAWISGLYSEKFWSIEDRYAFKNDINYMIEVLPDKIQAPITSLTLATLLESTDTTISRHANGILKALKNQKTIIIATKGERIEKHS